MKVTAALLGVALVATIGVGLVAVEPAEAPALRQRPVTLVAERNPDRPRTPAGPQQAPGSSGLDGIVLAVRTAAYAGAVQVAAEAAAGEAARIEAELAVKRAQLAELEQQGQQLDAVEAIVDESGVPAVWQCIHEHEQPDWHAPGNFEGGLGIMTEASDNYREQVDPSFPDPAYTASPAQQVAVAEWVLSYAGWGAWTTSGLCR